MNNRKKLAKISLVSIFNDEEEVLKQAALSILTSYCKMDMLAELQAELAAKYDKECFNGLKFRLATAVIKIDKSKCLEVILQSLINVTGLDALDHLQTLRQLAQKNQAIKCHDLLYSYTLNSRNDEIIFWWDAESVLKLKQENEFKFACINEAYQRNTISKGLKSKLS